VVGKPAVSVLTLLGVLDEISTDGNSGTVQVFLLGTVNAYNARIGNIFAAVGWYVFIQNAG